MPSLWGSARWGTTFLWGDDTGTPNGGIDPTAIITPTVRPYQPRWGRDVALLQNFQASNYRSMTERVNGGGSPSSLFAVTEYLGSSLSGSVSRHAIAMDAQRSIRELAVGRAPATAPLAVAASTVLGWKHHMAGGVTVTAASVDIDLPADTAAALPIGTELLVVSDTTGTQPTITAGAGATVNSPVTTPQITARYGVARCRKTAANTWTVTGDVS